jgi:hypothetical protein
MAVHPHTTRRWADLGDDLFLQSGRDHVKSRVRSAAGRRVYPLHGVHTTRGAAAVGEHERRRGREEFEPHGEPLRGQLDDDNFDHDDNGSDDDVHEYDDDHVEYDDDHVEYDDDHVEHDDDHHSDDDDHEYDDDDGANDHHHHDGSDDHHYDGADDHHDGSDDHHHDGSDDHHDGSEDHDDDGADDDDSTAEGGCAGCRAGTRSRDLHGIALNGKSSREAPLKSGGLLLPG